MVEKITKKEFFLQSTSVYLCKKLKYTNHSVYEQLYLNSSITNQLFGTINIFSSIIEIAAELHVSLH